MMSLGWISCTCSHRLAKSLWLSGSASVAEGSVGTSQPCEGTVDSVGDEGGVLDAVRRHKDGLHLPRVELVEVVPHGLQALGDQRHAPVLDARELVAEARGAVVGEGEEGEGGAGGLERRHQGPLQAGLQRPHLQPGCEEEEGDGVSGGDLVRKVPLVAVVQQLTDDGAHGAGQGHRDLNAASGVPKHPTAVGGAVGEHQAVASEALPIYHQRAHTSESSSLRKNS